MSLRHRCLGCGGSCYGVNVRPVDDAERSRVEAFGAQLGVEAVFEDGRLRRVDDRCVFLGSDERCRLHGAFGSEAKPLVCQQYPLVAVVAEGVPRLAIDPGCYTHARTWQDGPEHKPTRLRAGGVALSGPAIEDEARVLTLLEGCGSVHALLLGLVEARAPLSARFGAVTRAHVARLADSDALRTPGIGASVGASLRPALAGFADWSPTQPLNGEPYLLDAIGRALRLRSHAVLGAPTVAAFMLSVGALVAGGGSADEHAAGAAFAGWHRALRVREVVAALLAEPGAFGAWVSAARDG